MSKQSCACHGEGYVQEAVALNEQLDPTASPTLLPFQVPLPTLACSRHCPFVYAPISRQLHRHHQSLPPPFVANTVDGSRTHKQQLAPPRPAPMAKHGKGAGTSPRRLKAPTVRKPLPKLASARGPTWRATTAGKPYQSVWLHQTRIHAPVPAFADACEHTCFDYAKAPTLTCPQSALSP